MRSYVRLRLPDGGLCELGHGDLIGRLWTAALCLDDARVSEAHAMVSLRGQELCLLALRRRFVVAAEVRSEVVLEPGMRIELAEGLAVEVEELMLPDELLALEAEGLPRQTLPRVSSIVTKPHLQLVPRYLADAPAHVWSLGDRWRVRVGQGKTQEIEPGARFEIEGTEIRVVTVPLASAGEVATRVAGGIHAPLVILTRYESVHIQREGEPVVVLSGIAARMISELAAFGGPVGWEVAAREVWDEDDRLALRRKWDIALTRLRRKLRDARIRGDLIRADGNGNVELCLAQGDRVEDQA